MNRWTRWMQDAERVEFWSIALVFAVWPVIAAAHRLGWWS